MTRFVHAVYTKDGRFVSEHSSKAVARRAAKAYLREHPESAGAFLKYESRHGPARRNPRRRRRR